MDQENKLEVWMRGPIPNIPTLLQPVAHALEQAREDVNELTKDFPKDKLWIKPAGLASVGFHLQHMSGVVDRMFTYSISKPLDQQQLDYLAREGKEDDTITLEHLVQVFNTQVRKALDNLSKTDAYTLLEPRGIGRKQLPSNVIGLLFHAAEHIQRHAGQLLVTIRFVNSI